ncbi:hypothetical protein PR202_gb16918 [Eleusine coracana subsp. coracana]|uniref:Glutathione S-transferase n=1 Tax=Eleusine coracana subsp. coracana TaxID=191504 RepID=A0AAV5F3B0_ELECO|nr:hypothetical protein PR202_gb16918 [Eleusine coracana subsp. coracana]
MVGAEAFASGQHDEIMLLGLWASPFVIRARIVLNLKGLAYNYTEEDIYNKSEPLLRSYTVHKKVPMLIHNGKPVCESKIILDVDSTKRNRFLTKKERRWPSSSHLHALNPRALEEPQPSSSARPHPSTPAEALFLVNISCVVVPRSSCVRLPPPAKLRRCRALAKLCRAAAPQPSSTAPPPRRALLLQENQL